MLCVNYALFFQLSEFNFKMLNNFSERASISQDYWGHKRRLGVWGDRSPPAWSRGRVTDQATIQVLTECRHRPAISTSVIDAYQSRYIVKQ